jgi:predicted RNase H-like nuclease (RuvC/YqgF family)
MEHKSTNAQTAASAKWQKKVGLISKYFKLKKDVVQKFANACKAKGESQAAAITTFMNSYINADAQNSLSEGKTSKIEKTLENTPKQAQALEADKKALQNKIDKLKTHLEKEKNKSTEYARKHKYTIVDLVGFSILAAILGAIAVHVISALVS